MLFLNKKEICKRFKIDPVHVGAIDDIRFLLDLVSLDLEQVLEFQDEIDDKYGKLVMIRNRIVSSKPCDALYDLLQEAFDHFGGLKVEVQRMLNSEEDYSEEYDEEEERISNLIKDTLKRYPNSLIVKCQLDMEFGRYMPGDPLISCFGRKLVNLILHQHLKNKALDFEAGLCFPTIVWSYQWCKDGYWSVNMGLYLNLDVYDELGCMTNQESLAMLIGTAWAYALSINPEEASELIHFSDEENIKLVSDSESIVDNEYCTYEKALACVDRFTDDVLSKASPYRNSGNLNGAAYFTPG